MQAQPERGGPSFAQFERTMAKWGLDFTRRPGFPDCYRDDTTRTACVAWLEAQAAMPVAEPTGWIGVDDRLPKPWEDVMVWPHPTDYHITASVRQGKWTHSESDSWGQQDYACTVTHWMPLPDAPIDAAIAHNAKDAV